MEEKCYQDTKSPVIDFAPYIVLGTLGGAKQKFKTKFWPLQSYAEDEM